MNSSASVKLAAGQLPRLLHLPPDVVTSGAAEAIEFAEKACGIVLDPWQRWCVYWSLAERSDGSPAAFEVGIICPRQNGKNFILEVVQLASLYLAGDMTLVHSAHKFDTSVEHFNRLKFLLESTPELSVLLLPNDRSFVTSNGKEHIRLNTGQRILFKARHRGGGRGFTGDKVFLDEAYDLPASAIGNMIPTMSTRPNAQVFYTSSAPHESSSVLHAVRNRGQSDDTVDRLFYAEWGTDEDDYDTLLADDRAMMSAIRVANPGVAAGRITDEYIAQEIRTFSGDPSLVEEHRRERLGIASVPMSEFARPIPAEVWESLRDDGAVEEPSTTRLAFDVSPDRRFATFATAGRRPDGLGHVFIRDNAPGTDWVLERATALAAGHKCPITVAKGSPGASFIDEFERAGIAVDVMSTNDYAEACGRFIDATRGVTPDIRHRGQPLLRVALNAAQTKPAGDGGLVWSRRSSSTDITPLTTVTMAWGRVGDGATSSKPIFAW